MDIDLIKSCEAKAKEWLTSPVYDEQTKAEVKALLEAEDKTALVDAFYQSLEFGTGGLRGIMGAGTNRMNRYIVGAATQGFANYINKAFAGKKDIAVVVGHDCRNHGREFAETVANIFSANGIKVYLFESLRPTPEISFAIRQLKAQAGVNVTASHNPKEYNGYKAYWEDGAQVLAPHDTGIIDEVNKVKIEEVKFQGNPDLIQIIGGEMDWDYLQAVKEAMVDQEVINRQKDLNIVYTPLHGTGRVIIPEALRSWGFQNIHVVPEQMVSDGNFPTVVSPNPENSEAMTLNGNQTAMMFAWYIIANKKKLGQLKGNEFLVKTIVTTEIIKKIADKNGVELMDCYTGFKWIAALIRENEGVKKYIGGGEESFGFLPFDKVRDKDSPASICLICEIAAWAKDNGKTLYDLLMDIYLEYGFTLNHTINVVRPGKTGADEIKQMMVDFRGAKAPKTLAGSKVICTKDYQALTATDDKGNVTKLDMPAKSNVLQWFTESGIKISVRPSGTEPKIKFYIEAPAEMQCPKCYTSATAEAMAQVEAIKKDLGI